MRVERVGLDWARGPHDAPLRLGLAALPVGLLGVVHEHARAAKPVAAPDPACEDPCRLLADPMKRVLIILGLFVAFEAVVVTVARLAGPPELTWSRAEFSPGGCGPALDSSPELVAGTYGVGGAFLVLRPDRTFQAWMGFETGYSCLGQDLDGTWTTTGGEVSLSTGDTYRIVASEGGPALCVSSATSQVGHAGHMTRR